ncbi:MAG: 2-C-methyl-D-erythritol 2,4-cyclodiphosphate synthase [candidate division Zixibacteria bacterium]|nr:2-C-methyl-D-erythritol 2,4-cyclodiphosphate synthase [candidate division Zixibacteria bacterium]
MTQLRVGQGYDVHQLVEGRKLIIGGVAIPFERGLLGHSDADVLYHAVADALLGAAGLGDIGQHFPPSDDRYKDADSGELLAVVWGLVSAEGYRTIHNIDIVIMAERPKMAPHIPAMKKNLARILNVAEKQIGLKATTTETLGFVGREEGIAVSAVCLISSHE